MADYWMTISATAIDQAEAEGIARGIAQALHGNGLHGRVVQVDRAPPQGSLVVGDFWDKEDGIS